MSGGGGGCALAGGGRKHERGGGGGGCNKGERGEGEGETYHSECLPELLLGPPESDGVDI